jgi:hypothetical protein
MPKTEHPKWVVVACTGQFEGQYTHLIRNLPWGAIDTLRWHSELPSGTLGPLELDQERNGSGARHDVVRRA